MAKRSLTDEEIGLIKGMLALGTANDQAHFYFNRIDRLISSGRITQIKQGTYGAAVLTASKAAVDAHIAKFKKSGAIGASKVPIVGKIPTDPAGPTDPELLADMFFEAEAGSFRLKLGETDKQECKKSFSLKGSGGWVRAVAALANNKGGYIFFGIIEEDKETTKAKDQSHVVVGLDTEEFRQVDIKYILQPIKSALDPTPTVQRTTIELDGKYIGVLYVEQHPSRPVIVRSGDGTNIKEGDIFYRYPGSSERIKYSDLRAILDERDKVARERILPQVQRLIRLGPEKALVADLENGTLGENGQAIVIDPSLIEKIKFIREGEFDEKSGAPTLRLVGDVIAASGGAFAQTKLIRDKVGEGDILRNFLEQQSVSLPGSYITQGIDLQRKWLPLFYYIKQMNVIPSEFAAKLSSEKTSHPVKRDEIVNRLRGKISAKTKKIPTKLLGEVSSKLEKGSLPKFTLCKQALCFVDALACMTKTTLPLSEILNALKSAREIIEVEEPKSIGRLYKAACRIDEIFFA
jgi:Putative DNA-binding domain